MAVLNLKSRILFLFSTSLFILALTVSQVASAQQAAPVVVATPSIAPAASPARVVISPAPATRPTAPSSNAQVVRTRPAVAVAAPASDPYGFTNWLNGVRASHGLPPVGYDPNLSNWAAVNNNQQQARGIGHYVMGPARRQNSAMGAYANIGSMWMNSPGHRSALLDPTIRWIGIAGQGMFWTFNAN